MRLDRKAIRLFGVAALMLTATGSATAQTYQLTEITGAQLSTPGATVTQSGALSISNAGEVVGRIGHPAVTGYEYNINTRAISTLSYGQAGSTTLDAISGDGSYLLGFTGNAANPASAIQSFTDHNGTISTLPDPFGIQQNSSAQVFSEYYDINSSGATVGYYGDGTAIHGFLSSPDGTFTSLTDPNDNSGDTEATGINASGTVTGSYYDVTGNGANNGFLRNSNGEYATFDVPGATDTYIQGISDNGNLCGQFDTPTVNDNWAYVNGKFYTGIDASGATATFVTGINDTGQITGVFFDANKQEHSFYGVLAVPEASTTVSFGLLLVLGFGSFVAARKKRAAASLEQS